MFIKLQVGKSAKISRHFSFLSLVEAGVKGDQKLNIFFCYLPVTFESAGVQLHREIYENGHFVSSHVKLYTRRKVYVWSVGGTGCSRAS